jgi:DNA-binding CsgD family transcriptional regulator
VQVDKELIGRRGELAVVAEFLDSVANGPGALVIEGEPGIGKTTLWHEGLNRARARSLRTLSCRPTGAEVQLSFAALGDLVGGVLSETRSNIPTPQMRALEAALLLAEVEGPAPDQRAVGLGVLSVLRALSSEGTVLLAIDDVQWIDEPTAGVVQFALRRLDRERVGLLTTQRVDQEARVLLDLARTLPVVRIRLGPLSLGAIHDLLYHRLGASLPRPALVRIHDASGGNPFLALELGRALHDRGGQWTPDQALPVPTGLSELVSLRMKPLPARTRGTLLVVAALSQPTVALVTSASGAPHQVLLDLQRASRAGVIEQEDERLRFTHPLLGSVLYSQATTDQRRRLHRRLAEVLTDPEERARHLALAAQGPDPAVAAALDDAATRANARGAQAAAADLLERARTLTPEDKGADVARRGMQAADHHLAAGNTARARELLELLLAQTPHGPQRARLLHRLGEVRYHQDSWDSAQQLFEGALAETGQDTELRVEIELGLAFTRHVTGDESGAAAHAHAALELVERLGNDGLLSQALGHVSLYEFLLGRGIRRDLMERATTLDAAAGPPWLRRRADLFSAPVMWGSMLMWADDLLGAREVFDDLYARMHELGDEGSLPFLLINFSELECRAGNWDQAAKFAAEGSRVAELADQSTMVSATLFCQARVEAHLGLVDAARANAEAGLALARRTGNMPVALMNLSVLGFLELSLRNPAGAHSHLGPIAERLASAGVGEPGVLRFLSDEIEALIAVGELETATSLIDQLEDRGLALDRPWARAVAARGRGIMLAATGNLTGAHTALERALHEHERLAEPFELGRTLLVTGNVQRRKQQKRAARDTLELSLGIFDSLGARLWSDQARSELHRIGGRSAASGALTGTEQRIVDLVSEGRTNHEVAEVLCLSDKTVAWNLSKIYRKLGVRSRTELAVQRHV